ncbi:MAG: DUF4386 domain-containing protein [Actinomycetia bacterium]|nr:DUF4386 domain-containing protein [Actinomycetes bacterium]
MTTPTTLADPVTGTETTNRGSISRQHAAMTAGIGYVLLFGLAIFANFFVREGLVVADDAQATAANIAESNTLFRLGLVAFLAIFLIDIIVAWAIHIVFRTQHHDLSLVAAWSRLVYTVFLGVAAIFFFQALAFYDSTAVADVISSAERNAQAFVGIELFNSTWLIGLAAFGLHLIVLGALITRSAETPRWLGYAMIVAGAAYIIDTAAHTVLANYADHADTFLVMVSVPSVIAEGWFGLWLLIRARRSLLA